jgi:hypothetical protein
MRYRPPIENFILSYEEKLPVDSKTWYLGQVCNTLIYLRESLFKRPVYFCNQQKFQGKAHNVVSKPASK